MYLIVGRIKRRIEKIISFNKRIRRINEGIEYFSSKFTVITLILN